MDIDYRVLIPVTTQARRLKDLTSGIADKTKLIIVHNYNHPRSIEVSEGLKKDGATVVPFLGDNRGSCESWNIGLRMMDTTPARFVIILSPGTSFPKGADQFIHAVIEAEKSDPKLLYGIIGDGFHTVCITKKLHEILGLFDENLYPAYRDDADWQRRCSLLGPQFSETRFEIETEITLTTGARNNRIFAHYWANVNVQTPYYIKKWGGDVGMETYNLPFGDKPLNYWRPNQTKKVRLSKITQGMADHWIGKRRWPNNKKEDGRDKEWE